MPLLVTAFLIITLLFVYLGNDFAIKSIKTDYDKSTLLKKAKLEPETTLLLAGDVMLGRSVMQKYIGLGNFTYPFEKVGEKLKSADIVFINLENPVIQNCPLHSGGYKFCSPPESVDGLLYSGVDVVTLANNHSGNYGKEGLAETVDFLGKSGIAATGLGELVILESEGTTYGFLGFDKAQQTQPKLTAAEAELIENSDLKVDVLIVAMHWGVEYQDKALPGVRNLARELVAAGVDVVVGHHPHWVQDYESIDGKPVYYSLGNFIFDQMWSEKTKEGIVIELVYKDKKLVSSQQLPTYMPTLGQPQFIEE